MKTHWKNALFSCSCASIVLFFGCGQFFGERHSLVTTIPAGTSSPFAFEADLTSSTRYIEFDGFHGQSGAAGLLRISIINCGRSSFRAKNADGKWSPVEPNASVDVFNNRIDALTNSPLVPVSQIGQRTPCEFRLEISHSKQFRDLIKVYLFKSSAPM